MVTADTALSVPVCGGCGISLNPRPETHQTREQLWCGQWWDHPWRPGGLTGHTVTHLVPSQDLAECLTSFAPDLTRGRQP